MPHSPKPRREGIHVPTAVEPLRHLRFSPALAPKLALSNVVRDQRSGLDRGHLWPRLVALMLGRLTWEELIALFNVGLLAAIVVAIECSFF